ncbi:tape measure protein [Mesobacillus stamsii]|uniref:Tape measure domain-containing protein n=1 Tax=Mesobacillus stamsii TaxID=225347 RepID=A0ABU0FWE3_9BACI|nr:tape measure protein [Mesobacillus stamsii]MDQ0414238.1 tape measure domain-containing protein [Mesobacillus stamsii]
MASKNTVEIILSAKDMASRAVQKSFGSIQKSAGVAMKAAGVAAAAAGGGLATLTGIVGKVGFSYNAMAEQSGVAWKTLLGSQEEAKKMLQDISNFTKATPFETEDVDMMAKYMHNAGLEGQALFDSLMKVSDVASAFSIPASEAKEMTRQMSQVRQAGVAYTEDLNILQDRGVPIYKAIAEQQGIMVKDVKKMASEGKLSSEIYVAAFDSIAKGVTGASEEQSKTFNGMLSTLKDNLSMISGELMSGAFDKMKGALDAVMPVLDNFLSNLRNGGIKEAVLGLFPPSFAENANNFIEIAKGAFDNVQEIFVNNKDRISGVIDGIKGFFELLKSYWLGWIDYIKGLFTGDGNIGESFFNIFNTIKEVAVPILQDAIGFIKDILDQLKTFWDENGAQIIEAVQNLWSVIAAIFKAVAPVLGFIIEMIWSNIKGVISGAIDIILGVVKVFSSLLTGDFSGMWEGVKQLFFGAIEFIWNFINLMMFGRILGGIKTFATNGAGLFKEFWTKSVEIFKNLDTYVMNIITDFATKFVGKIQGLYDMGARIFGMLRGFGESAFTAMKNTIISLAENIWFGVKSKFSGLYESIKGVFGNIISSASNTFGKVQSAITKPIETAKNTILGFIEKIKGAFKNMGVNIPLPHFGVSNFSMNPADWVKNGIPKLSVKWYDTGGVFYGPQVIGVGEKRPEFVGALDDLEDIVRNVIRSENGSSGGGNQVYEFHISIPLDGRELVKRTIRFTAQELEAMKRRTNRQPSGGLV